MKLAVSDITIVIGYIALTLGVGIAFSRRGTDSVQEYFVGGRNLSWWLAGTSMVASSFAIDTPFGITGLVAAYGVSGVWFAWSFAIGGAGTLGAFIFAPLLRRSGVLTIAELAELRYSGTSAAALRALKGVYFGVLSLGISMGWVIRSVVSVCQEAFGWDATPILMGLVILTLAYTMASGFWGVAITDVFQFFIGTFGSLALAYYSLGSIGGKRALMNGLRMRFGEAQARERLRFVPHSGMKNFPAFLTFVTLKWWGNPPGSISQRVLATRNDRHATFSMLFFAAVHFALNYWPMIICALVSLVCYPQLPLKEAEAGYAKLLFSVLPTGVLGLSLAALTAAFMSTIDTQANTGASYLINDLYRRFFRPNASEKHYVWAGQLATALMVFLGVVAFYAMGSVRDAWEYVATMVAGYGFVVVARWFWWRINAWTEMAALVGSALGSIVSNHLLALEGFSSRFCLSAAVSTVAWVVTASVTTPCPLDRLAEFCRKVRPYPAFWGPVKDHYPDIEWSPHLLRHLLLAIVSLIGLYGLCFGVGHYFIGDPTASGPLLIMATVCTGIVLTKWRAS